MVMEAIVVRNGFEPQLHIYMFLWNVNFQAAEVEVRYFPSTLINCSSQDILKRSTLLWIKMTASFPSFVLSYLLFGWKISFQQSWHKNGWEVIVKVTPHKN